MPQNSLLIEPMRVSTLLAMLLLATMTLSGCFGSDDEPATHADECDDVADHDACHGGDNMAGGNNMTGNVTTGNATPNVPPVAMMQMMSQDGRALNGTNAILSGELVNFTFNGSMDPDGVLELAALTIIDGNASSPRTINIELGSTVTVNFDDEGPVTAILRLLDDEGAAGVAASTTFVNSVQRVSANIWAAEPSDTVSADDCEGPGGAEGFPLVEQNAMTGLSFNTKNNTRWIEATVAVGTIDIAICAPDKSALTGESDDTVSTDEFDVAPGVSYYVFAIARESHGTPDEPGEIAVDVIVHWEPKPAA